MSAFGHLSPQRELELAQELLGVQSEEELDRFLPLLLPAIKAAAPLLKSVAGSLLGGLGGGGGGGGGAARGRRRRRPASQEEYFLGNIVKGLLGEMQPENEQEEQFLGRIRRVLRGAGGLLGEEEQFIGGLIGKLFGGRRELEAETPNYVQEQFIGGLIGRLFGGRRELHAEAPGPRSTLRPPGARRITACGSAALRTRTPPHAR
jgi:hypothetical protein